MWIANLLKKNYFISNNSVHIHDGEHKTEQAVWEDATICPRPLQVDLLTLKAVSESRVTWATSMPILVFLGLSVLDLGPMYVTDVRRASSLNAPAMGTGHNNTVMKLTYHVVSFMLNLLQLCSSLHDSFRCVVSTSWFKCTPNDSLSLIF